MYTLSQNYNCHEKRAFGKKKNLFNSKFDLNIKKMLMESYVWSTALCSAEN
jgi:hypothetical protein